MSAAKPADANWPGAIQAFASAKNCRAAIFAAISLVGGQDGCPTIPVGVKHVSLARKCFSFAEKHKLLEAARWQWDVSCGAPFSQ